MVEPNDADQHNASELRTRLRVLVVDDDDDSLVVLGQLLESEGYAVVQCRSALAGLAHLEEGTQPDIIVLDLHMPVMSGWEFRIEQKRDSRWASIPVVALSGDLSPQAAAIDAAAYLAKPVDHEAFLQTVRAIARNLQRSRAVARVSELQRLVSLGTLVGGLAHEINNPLTFVSGNVEALQRQFSAEQSAALLEPGGMASAQRALERVRTGVDRISAVVSSVSLFAFADSGVPEPIDVHEVLEASLQIASNDLRHCARLVRTYVPVPRVMANPASLGQVFLNLLLNAVFAIREHSQDGHEVHVESAVRGDQVAITIADTASTLRPGVKEHIFDPLISENTVGRLGLRFGLAISRELIDSLGGSIELEENEPRGSRFRVVLPSCGKISYPAPPLAMAPLIDDKRPTVLVIDDDTFVSELLAAMLSDDYEVMAFTSPVEALAALSETEFDAVLCDVMMPQLDGLALFERAIQARPSLQNRFVFVTGGAFTEQARAALRRTRRRVIRKPCKRDDLLAAIKETLHAAQLEAARA